MPWLRLWVDILDSEKIAELDDASFRGWTFVLISAKKFDRGGLLPPVKRIAYWSRRPEAEVRGWIRTLQAAGLVDAGKDGPRVHDWDYWQEPKDRTNARRQKGWRERQKGSLDPPRPEAEPETEQSRAEQTVTPPPLRETRNGVSNDTVTPLRAGPAGARGAASAPRKNPSDPEVDRLANLAAELAGDISWSLWVSSQALMGHPPHAIEEALTVCVNKGKWSRDLAGSVLRRLCTEGYPQTEKTPRLKPTLAAPKIYGAIQGP